MRDMRRMGMMRGMRGDCRLAHYRLKRLYGVGRV